MRYATSIGALEDSVGFLLKRAQIATSAQLHRIFSEFDVTAVQFSVLTLVEQDPGMSQAELAVALRVERPRMVPVLDRLAARGLAERRPDEHDGRTRRIYITAAGTELLRKLQVRFDAQERRIAEALGPEARDALVAGLRRLAEMQEAGSSDVASM